MRVRWESYDTVTSVRWDAPSLSTRFLMSQHLFSSAYSQHINTETVLSAHRNSAHRDSAHTETLFTETAHKLLLPLSAYINVFAQRTGLIGRVVAIVCKICLKSMSPRVIFVDMMHGWRQNGFSWCSSDSMSQNSFMVFTVAFNISEWMTGW